MILSVNAYMLSDGGVVGDCIYAKWMMMMWWRLLIELWLDWLCGCKYLIMQLLLKLININGGYPLYCCWIYMRWFYIVESLLVCSCIIVMLSCWCCKRGLLFYFGDNVRRAWNLTYDVFVASSVTTLRWFGTTCIYVSGIGA